MQRVDRYQQIDLLTKRFYTLLDLHLKRIKRIMNYNRNHNDK